MAVADIHPDLAELEAFALGTLNDAALADIEEHVANCPRCQEQAARTAGDSLVELLRRAHERSAFAGDTVSPTAFPARTPAPVAVEGITEALGGPAHGEDAGGLSVPADLARHERYRVVRLLGEGGMGSVYEAEHLVMQRPVALKVINRAFTARPAVVERFRREVRAAARLSHPNIVTAFDAENAGETHFLVMEFVEGVSLGQLVKERGPLPAAEACDYIRQAALGLQHAHERGMVHRDVKPDNLIRCADGNVKVLDFGLAALTAERGGLTDTNLVMGTPDYMAPEQAENASAADIRADVYSLGCTLYYLLTGSVPYPAATPLLKILAHREQPLPSLRAARPDVPPELAGIVARLLAKKPEQRYQTPGDVAAALEPFTRPQGEKARPRRRLLIAAAAALLFITAAAGVVVHRIQTDNGELVITTESPDVEVIVKGDGKVVRIIDTKTDKEIRLTLRSGSYELELKGAPEGLKLNIDKATLTRGETVLARIERVAPPIVPAVGLVRRLPWENRERGPRVRFSSDGRYCAAAGGGCPLAEGKTQAYRVWEVSTGKLIQQLAGFRGFSWVSVFTPDGRELVTLSRDEIVRWDVQTGQKLAAFMTRGTGDLLDISPDGKWLAVFANGPDWNYGNSIHVFDLKTGKEAWRVDPLHPRSILDEGALFTADGKQLLTMDGDKRAGTSTFRFLDRATGKVARSFEVAPCLHGTFALVEGGRQVAASYSDPETEEWFVGFWNVADGKLVRKVKIALKPAFVKTAETVIVSGDGRFLSSNHPKDHTVRIFELSGGTEILVHDKIPNPTYVQFSPDGRHAACDGSDGVYLFRLPESPADKDKP